MGILKTNQWKEKLERLIGSLPTRDPDDFFKEICDLGVGIGDDAGEALLDDNPDLFEHAPALRRAYYQRVTNNDIAETQRLLQREWDGPTHFKDVAGAPRLVDYNRSLDMFEHLDFSNCRCLVSVGCGRVPFTVFHVHEKTTIPEIIGLDILPEAIEAADALAARLGYGRMRTELRDGRSYDYSKAQIVYIAGMVSPKSAVLSRIIGTAPDDVEIVVREPYSLARLWLESIEHSLDPRLEVFGTGRGHWSLNRDVYLKRRAPSAPPVRAE